MHALEVTHNSFLSQVHLIAILSIKLLQDGLDSQLFIGLSRQLFQVDASRPELLSELNLRG